MAKFCTKCGKKLEEGKTCDCQKKKKTVKEEETNDVAKEVGEAVDATAKAIANNDYVKKIMSILKTIFVKPVDTMKKNTKENNFVVGLIGIGLTAIFAGLFTYLYLKEFVGTIFSAFSSFGFGSVEIPFFKTFILGAFFIVVVFFSIAVAIYAIQSWILKKEASFKKIISLIGMCALVAAIVVLIAILGIYLVPEYALTILGIGGLFFGLLIFQGLKFTSDQDENTYVYTFISALIFTGIILFVLISNIMN